MADTDGFNGPRRNDEDGFGRLLADLRNTKERLAAVERGAPLKAAGVGVNEDGMVVDSSLEVTGSLDVTGDLSVSGSATVTGEDGLLWLDGAGRERMQLGLVGSSSVEDVVRLAYIDRSDNQRVVIGELTSGGAVTGHGILVQAADGTDLFGIAETGHASLRGDGFILETVDGSAQIYANPDSSVVVRSPHGFNIYTSGSPSTASHAVYTGGDDLIYRAPTRHYMFTDGGTGLHVVGNISASGTKPFVIDHPLHEDKSLVHAATESDKAVLEYHYRATIGPDGSTTIDLPDYFEALVAPDSRGVQVTPAGRPFLVGAEEPTDGQVVVYGEPGREVFVRVNARRGDDAGQFEVEIPRIQPPSEEAS